MNFTTSISPPSQTEFLTYLQETHDYLELILNRILICPTEEAVMISDCINIIITYFQKVERDSAFSSRLLAEDIVLATRVGKQLKIISSVVEITRALKEL